MNVILNRHSSVLTILRNLIRYGAEESGSVTGNLNFKLLWRHNGSDGVSYHQPQHCLLNRLIRRGSKKTSKLRVTGLCAGNSPVTGEFPAQMASNAEIVSIWWRHREAGYRQTKWTGWVYCLVKMSTLSFSVPNADVRPHGSRVLCNEAQGWSWLHRVSYFKKVVKCTFNNAILRNAANDDTRDPFY